MLLGLSQVASNVLKSLRESDTELSDDEVKGAWAARVGICSRRYAMVSVSPHCSRFSPSTVGYPQS